MPPSAVRSLVPTFLWLWWLQEWPLQSYRRWALPALATAKWQTLASASTALHRLWTYMRSEEASPIHTIIQYCNYCQYFWSWYWIVQCNKLCFEVSSISYFAKCFAPQARLFGFLPKIILKFASLITNWPPTISFLQKIHLHCTEPK